MWDSPPPSISPLPALAPPFDAARTLANLSLQPEKVVRRPPGGVLHASRGGEFPEHDSRSRPSMVRISHAWTCDLPRN
eukprot:7554542-Pyramimonas_sp.AAC.1